MRYFKDQNGSMGGPHENEFWVFSNSEMNITDSQIGKSRSRIRVICLVFMFSSWVMVLKLSKKWFVSARNLCLLKHIYISKVSLRTFRKWYCLLCMNYCFRDISIWNWRILLNFCWFSIFFDILIANRRWLGPL